MPYKIHSAVSRLGGIKRAAIIDGDRELRRTSIRFGEEIRELRLRAGVSQAAVGRAIGVDRSVICRLEQGDPEVSLFIRSRVASLLGAEFRLSLYPTGPALVRDKAQSPIVEQLLAVTDSRWRPTVEAAVPGPGRRSSDIRLDNGTDLVLIEVETRVRSFEEIVRELHTKRAAVEESTGSGRPVHVVLVLPPTRHHRALIRDLPASVRAAFPAASVRIMQALSSPSEPWPGDGLLWVSGARKQEVIRR